MVIRIERKLLKILSFTTYFRTVEVGLFGQVRENVEFFPNSQRFPRETTGVLNVSLSML